METIGGEGIKTELVMTKKGKHKSTTGIGAHPGLQGKGGEQQQPLIDIGKSRFGFVYAIVVAVSFAILGTFLNLFSGLR